MADTTNTTVVDTGLLRPPTRPIRTSTAAREYTARVYQLNALVSELEGGLSVARPEEAYLTRRERYSWPAQSVINIASSRGMRRTGSLVSEDSLEETVREISIPTHQLLDAVEASQGPGVYKCTITNPAGQTRSASSSDQDPDETQPISYSLQRIDVLEGPIATAGYLEKLYHDHPLPEPEHSQRHVWLRYAILSTYRRIFALVILANVIAMLCMIAQFVQDPGSFTLQQATTAISANLFAAGLMRHEHCVNLIFRACVSLPVRLPVAVRRLAAKVYSYGGIHSGCGVSALLWYIFFNVLICTQLEAPDALRETIAVLTAFLDFLLITLVCTSHPRVRSTFHDQWELGHRYLGWAAVALVWAQLWVFFAVQVRMQGHSIWLIAIEAPAFWFTLGITVLMVYPWLRLRRVEVASERLSEHAARIRFPNYQRRVSAAVGMKLSKNPLKDNHSFATIADPDGEKGYSLLVSNAGDWTNELINNPPKHLWKRGAPVIGVMRLAQLFRPIVIVATGSGIGPCMSFLQTHPGWPCRVVWSTKIPEVQYGRKMIEEVLAADRDAVIVDTAKTGRPNMVHLVYAVYKLSKAEAVVIISNPKTVSAVVYGLEQRKVPAFGPIFDS